MRQIYIPLFFFHYPHTKLKKIFVMLRRVHSTTSAHQTIQDLVSRKFYSNDYWLYVNIHYA